MGSMNNEMRKNLDSPGHSFCPINNPLPHLKPMISVITGTKKQSEIIKHLFIFVIPPFPGFFCIKIIVLDLK